MTDKKNKIIIVRVPEKLRNKFLEECNRRYEVPITYSKLIRQWIENWVERGDPSKSERD